MNAFASNLSFSQNNQDTYVQILNISEIDTISFKHIFLRNQFFELNRSALETSGSELDLSLHKKKW